MNWRCRGYRTKKRIYKNGRTVGGIAFRTGSLAQLLKNPIYAGNVRHNGNIYDGEHDAIIDKTLFEEVQTVFATNRTDNALGKKAKSPSLLAGLITDPDGRPMTPTHASNGTKRFRYYVSRTAPGADKTSVWRLPSGEIERFVTDTLAKAIIDTRSISDQAKGIQNHIAMTRRNH